jgi:hypothetical protein
MNSTTDSSEDATENLPDQPQHQPQRPWIVLEGTYDIEAWINSYNRDLQLAMGETRIDEKQRGSAKYEGVGICFYLSAGGAIFLHTTGEGDILLDVTPEAAWIAPLLTAATGQTPPRGQIWMLPAEVLTQLIFGLNSLIGTTQLVLTHHFHIRKY